MDLIFKSIIAVVLVVAALFVVYYIFQHVSLSQPISRSQASSLVLRDLENNNPDAAINITNVTPSQYQGSWHIVASVIDNAESPCPSYEIYSFDYPAYSFVYRVDNKYTNYTQNACIIYGFIAGNYTVGSYPVAIARSYQLNDSSVSAFVARYGYSNVKAIASYYADAYLNGSHYTKIWLVNYTAPGAGHAVHVVLSQLNGSALGVYNTT